MDHELLVLGLLKLRDMHGYQLGDLIDKRLNYLTDLKKPTLYSMLNRLQSDGLVTKTVSREGHRPERYTYSLTTAGEARFVDLLRDNLKQPHMLHLNDDIGLLFLNELETAQAQEYLQEKLVAIRQRITEMQHQLALHERDTPAYYTLRHHLIHMEADRAWLDELKGQLKHKRVQSDILQCLDETHADSRQNE